MAAATTINFLRPPPLFPTISCAVACVCITSAAMSQPISRKRSFVADGVFYAELNELLTRELAGAGYSGVEVRKTPRATQIVISATKTQEVLGQGARGINELTSIIQKRFKFKEGVVELYAERVANRCARLFI